MLTRASAPLAFTRACLRERLGTLGGMRRRMKGIALATIAALAVGCAGSAQPQPPAPSHTSSSEDEAPTMTHEPSAAAAAVEAMTVEERAASVVMGHIGTRDPDAAADYMTAGLGGFILMGSNVTDEASLQELVQGLTIDADTPPLVAIDQEGGVVSRLGWDDLPAGPQLQSENPAATREAFEARAELVAATGANVNFGIVADVPASSDAFIASRALGADPASAADRVAAAVAGEHGLVYSTLKHFPGHGAASGDSHEMIPETGLPYDEWLEADALPFIAGIEAGAELLMIGHLTFSDVDHSPASLSPRWHEIAREELGFEGVIVSDDLGMLLSSGVAEYEDPVQNAVDALAAGTDMVLMIAGSDADTADDITTGIVAAVESGALPEDRLREAAERVMTLRLQLAEAD